MYSIFHGFVSRDQSLMPCRKEEYSNIDLSVAVSQVQREGLEHVGLSNDRFSNHKLERTLIGGLCAELEF